MFFLWAGMFLWAPHGVFAQGPDRDRDRLEDAEEIALGTDPDNPDSDNDGFLDGEEVEYSSDPLNPDSFPDLPQGAAQAVFGPVFSLLDTATLATSPGLRTVVGPPLWLLNTGTIATSEALRTVISPALWILNTTPPPMAGGSRCLLSPQWSTYNGDLDYDPELPPYVTSVRLSDRNGQPYTSGEHTDEATVRVEVTTAWEVDSFIISADGFATSATMAPEPSFEYTFADYSEGRKTLWVKAMKDDVVGSAAMDGIWLRRPQSTHVIETLGSEHAGWILSQGAAEEWTFSGTMGQYVTVIVNPRAPYPPYLEYASIALISPTAAAVASAQNAAGAKAVLAKVELPETGTYRLLVSAGSAAPNATGNYTVALYDSTPRVRPLVFNDRRYGSLEQPYALDAWTFSASADTLVRLIHHAGSGPGLRYELRGPGGWTGFAVQDGGSDPVNLPSPGAYRLEAFAPNGQADLDYSFTLQSLDAVAVEPGTPYHGATEGDNQLILFRFELAEGEPLLVDFDAAADGGVHALYLRHNNPATRQDFDYRAEGAAADQRILVSSAYPGTWYLLLCVDRHAGSGDFTLRIEQEDVILVSVAPSQYGATAGVSTILEGLGFTPDTQVELASDPLDSIQPTAVHYVSSEKLIADWDLTGARAGQWMLRVTKGSGSSARPFAIVSGGEADFWTNLILPASVGRHTQATIWIEYGNRGSASMPAPLLVLTAAQKLDGQEGAYLTLDKTKVRNGLWTNAAPEGFSHSVQFLAHGVVPGLIQPGESRRVPVYYIGWKRPWDFSNTQYIWDLGVLDADSAETVDWPSLKDSVRPDTMPAEAWDGVWANFTSGVGSTWGDYVRMLSDNAVYLGRLGIDARDVGELLAFEFAQADGFHILNTVETATDAYVPAPGLAPALGRSFPNTVSDRCRTGAFGRGWSHNWEYSLTASADGKVTVERPGGSRRVFEPSRVYPGRYLARSGDRGELVALGGGRFALRENDGLERVFESTGRLDYVKDPNNNRIDFGYTEDRLTTLTHSGGQRLSVEWNGDRVTAAVDSLGRRTAYAYSGEYLASVTYDDGSVVAYDYETGSGSRARHALTAIHYPGGYGQVFEYDAMGRLVRTHRGGNAEAVSFAFDEGEIRTTDNLGHTTRLFLDHFGLTRRAIDPLGRAVVFDYDDARRLTRVTDPTGRSTSYVYDEDGNVAGWTDVLGNVTRLEHGGPFDRLSLLTDAKGNATRYGYDARGNLASVAYPNDTVERWSYRANGTPSGWANCRIQSIGYDFDAFGRLTAKRYPGGSSVEYAYDARGNLIRTSDAQGVTTFDYDERDRLIRIAYPYPAPPNNAWLEYAYNEAGQRASMTDQLGHRLDYHYDAVGRLEFMTDETTTEAVRYQYDAAGRLEKKTLGNGVYTDYVYDDAGQLRSLHNHKPNGEDLSYFVYEYDSRGRRVSMDTHYGSWTYEYDDTGQLTRAVLASTDPEIENQDLQYVYDALGNRIRTVLNGETTEYATNNMNQYVQVGDTTYAFDDDGNTIQEDSPTSGTAVYSYNTENRLVDVARGIDAWHYEYDALGNRVATSDNGIATRYAIDPFGLGDVVGEYGGAGNLLARYDHGLGLLSRTEPANAPACYAFDATGNAHQLIADTVLTANDYAYTPFGESLRRTETLPNPFQFVGEFGVMSETHGLDFMRARFFEPTMGRFLSADPLGYDGRNGTLYSYCANDPISFVDPLGRIPAWLSWLLEKLKPLLPAGPGVAELEGVAEVGLEGASTYVIQQQRRWRCFEETGQDWWPDLGGEPSPEWAERFPNAPRPEALPADSGSSGITGSQDPNLKTGPGGLGLDGRLAPGSLMAYCIDFENQPTATAPAQIVAIDDRLDENLDWTTFELTELAFGEAQIFVPEGTRRFEGVRTVALDGKTLEAHIDVDVNLGSGLLSVRLVAIDPETGLLPSVEYGLLPPEDGTGRGQGHISYTIKPKSGLPDATTISNSASIVFDGNPAIETNTVTNTVGETSHTLTADATNGSVVKSPDLATYEHGTTVGLTAIPATGHHFVHWTGDVPSASETESQIVLTMDSDKTVTAESEINEYTVTFQTDGTPGAMLLGISPQTVGHGGDCTAVTAVAPAGFHFGDWVLNGASVYSAANPLAVTNVIETMTLRARFVDDNAPDTRARCWELYE